MTQHGPGVTGWPGIFLPLAIGFLLGLMAFLVLEPPHAPLSHQAHLPDPGKNAPAHYPIAGPNFDRA